VSYHYDVFAFEGFSSFRSCLTRVCGDNYVFNIFFVDVFFHDFKERLCVLRTCGSEIGCLFLIGAHVVFPLPVFLTCAF
jgi:hypothetical protein